ncbi:uncharacterized protein LOC125178539 [Hyalella azteca]|uniref:Uncharacterized protein LOC125178539 n=1 Tax=Hyalella azteca TaxID=294128 RepID=A0A979FN53_HYAAZ|nr:uncharacterized protein LOC125178539 [Hyalella azteca]
MKWKETLQSARLVVEKKLSGAEKRGQDDTFVHGFQRPLRDSKCVTKSLESLDNYRTGSSKITSHDQMFTRFSQRKIVDVIRIQAALNRTGSNTKRSFALDASEKNDQITSEDDDGGFVNIAFVSDSGEKSLRKLTAAVSGRHSENGDSRNHENNRLREKTEEESVVWSRNIINFSSGDEICCTLNKSDSEIKLIRHFQTEHFDENSLNEIKYHPDTTASEKNSFVKMCKSIDKKIVVNEVSEASALSCRGTRNPTHEVRGVQATAAADCGGGFVADDGDAPPRKMVMVEFCTYGGSFRVVGEDGEAQSRYINMKLHEIAASGGAGRRVLVVVSLAGVKICDAHGKRVLMAHALRRISYATCDPQRQCFSFLARAPRDDPATQSCHSFLTATPQQSVPVRRRQNLEQSADLRNIDSFVAGVRSTSKGGTIRRAYESGA